MIASLGVGLRGEQALSRSAKFSNLASPVQGEVDCRPKVCRGGKTEGLLSPTLWRKESPRRRKAHMRAFALRQPLRFLRLRLLFPKNLC